MITPIKVYQGKAQPINLIYSDNNPVTYSLVTKNISIMNISVMFTAFDIQSRSSLNQQISFDIIIASSTQTNTINYIDCSL